ncbi:MAG: hypothetical protein M1449_00765 [Candidatus Thermoplasmatota archaeon]|nr:hypothetical protein [Candidatus Thermoplasmatota archaeon]
MSGKERVVFLDRAAFTADDLPIQRFEHNWSEHQRCLRFVAPHVVAASD